ncbi:MAG TPA: hypothetical protein VK395_17200, partial [Gemmataceae bacterium]|nr:hypothetical protein [Gemmataceae bacterium]
AQSEARLFPTQPAIRWRLERPLSRPAIGANSPEGAIINYFLKDKPKERISLDILDSRGELVDTLKSKPKPKGEKKESPGAGKGPEAPATTEADDDEEEEGSGEGDYDAEEGAVAKKTVLPTEKGVNRVAWNLRYKGAEKIKGAKVDTGAPDVGPLVNPGVFTVKLKVGAKVLATAVTVLPDPRMHLSTSEAEEQLKMVLALRDDLSRVTRMANQIRSIKKQLEARNELLKGNLKTESLVKPGKELIKKLDALEEKLHNPKAQVTYDILAQRGGAKLLSQFAFLYENAKDADGAPTQGMREVYAEDAHALQQCATELNALLGGELTKINETAKVLAIPNIIVKETKQETTKKP